MPIPTTKTVRLDVFNGDYEKDTSRAPVYSEEYRFLAALTIVWNENHWQATNPHDPPEYGLIGHGNGHIEAILDYLHKLLVGIAESDEKKEESAKP